MKQPFAAALVVFNLIVMPIYTYGHVLNHTSLCADSAHKEGDAACEAVVATHVAIFWPLYWSYQLQKPEDAP